MKKWQLQEAKNKLSEVVEEALKGGPQMITRRGAEEAIVISYEEYRRLVSKQQKLSIFFRNSPLAKVSLGLDRDKSPNRPEPRL